MTKSISLNSVYPLSSSKSSLSSVKNIVKSGMDLEKKFDKIQGFLFEDYSDF